MSPTRDLEQGLDPTFDRARQANISTLILSSMCETSQYNFSSSVSESLSSDRETKSETECCENLCCVHKTGQFSQSRNVSDVSVTFNQNTLIPVYFGTRYTASLIQYRIKTAQYSVFYFCKTWNHSFISSVSLACVILILFVLK